MKAQFKYAIRAGLHVRGTTFAIIFALNLIFIVPGLLGLLPLAAQITAVALSGVAIAVMAVVNIVSDVGIAGRIFFAPGAYLHALTPAPRKQILLSSVVTMLVMDMVTMAVAITGVVVLSLSLARNYVGGIDWETASYAMFDHLYMLSYVALMIAGYLLILMIILFCVAMRKSVLFQRPAGGLMTALLALGICYAVSISPLLTIPFGSVSRFGLFFIVTLGNAGTFMYALLTLIQAAVLFVLTSKILERKINI